GHAGTCRTVRTSRHPSGHRHARHGRLRGPRRLRLDPRHAGTTLVALTGWSQVQDQQRARDAGFDHHFSKPADIGALQRVLASLVPAAAEN
ncbi:MAG: hypothetical protein M3414_05545, partial [Pseudomonadota bacterium]|nr:hypothetical protein [Pseudomonadota bacterium]